MVCTRETSTGACEPWTSSHLGTHGLHPVAHVAEQGRDPQRPEQPDTQRRPGRRRSRRCSRSTRSSTATQRSNSCRSRSARGPARSWACDKNVCATHPLSYSRNGMSIFVLLLYSGYAVGKDARPSAGGCSPARWFARPLAMRHLSIARLCDLTWPARPSWLPGVAGRGTSRRPAGADGGRSVIRGQCGEADVAWPQAVSGCMPELKWGIEPGGAKPVRLAQRGPLCVKV